MLGNCKESERGEEHITGTKGQELVQFKKRERGREGGRERSETMHQKQQTLQAIPSASSGNYLTTELNINS
jgi:hypothetical protein|uniref:Uncharacterized protein n=1 Tax=Populus trichocarpa TaxID=3694 RepID=U5G9N8_POPTR